MLSIKIEYPFAVYSMFKEVIAGIFAGSFDLSVNDAGTEVTVLDLSGGSSTNLTIVGTGLTLSGYNLAGGHVTGFGYHDPNTGVAQADISGVNLDATALQGLIDVSTSVEQLQDELFDNRPQKIIGSPLGDYVQGGHAADIIKGNGGDDYIFASEGNDAVYGNAGNDTLDFSRVANLGGVTVDLRAHTASFGTFQQTIYGFEHFALTDKGDTVYGDQYANPLTGGGGGDDISGGGGNDTIDGSDGKDTLAGNGGKDTIIGNQGNDLIHGGANDDFIQGDLDTNSTLAGKDTIYGGAGNDIIHGNSGADSLFGGADADLIDGGPGKDHISGSFGTDIIHGGPGDDVIYGGPDNDNLFGGGKDDHIHGDGGKDKIVGGAGDDKLFGGGGNDVIIGGSGLNDETGGAGRDTFVFDSRVSGETTEIHDFNGYDKIVIHNENLDTVEIAQDSYYGTNTVIFFDYGHGQCTVDNWNFSFFNAVQSGGDVVITL